MNEVESKGIENGADSDADDGKVYFSFGWQAYS